MSFRGVVTSAVLLALCAPGAASASPRWWPAETVDTIRGVPQPQVAIDGRGKAVLAYTNADEADLPLGSALEGPWPALAVRDAGRGFAELQPQLSGSASDVATNSQGATALVALHGGQVLLSTYGPPGVSSGPASPGFPGSEPSLIWSGAAAATDAKVAIDSAGRVTTAWLSPAPDAGADPPSGVYTQRPGGVVRRLATPDSCSDLSLDVNERGDAALGARCGAASLVFFAAAGGEFGAGVDPFGLDQPPSAPSPSLGVALDGAGSVHAFATRGPSPKFDRFRAFHAVRPPAGPFGEKRELTFVATNDRSFDLDVREDGRAVAAAGGDEEDGGLRLSVRPAGGDFGRARTLRGQAAPTAIDVASAPHGGALVAWIEGAGDRAAGVAPATNRNIGALTVDAAGDVSPVRQLAVPGDVRGVPDAAIGDGGHAVVVWEQRCSRAGAFAVMASALDEARMGRKPPCQDMRPPKVISTVKRARLRGRTLRARIACDERCAVTASSRTLRQGSRRPIAKAKLPRERTLRARRGAALKLKLSLAEAVRVARALGRSHRVSLRLSVSVRDTYGNGRIWRLRLPVSR
jgi:hypothetical protein